MHESAAIIAEEEDQQHNPRNSWRYSLTMTAQKLPELDENSRRMSIQTMALHSLRRQMRRAVLRSCSIVDILTLACVTCEPSSALLHGKSIAFGT